MKASWLLIGSLVCLSACSNPKVASDGNFRRAIDNWIEKDPPCLRLRDDGLDRPGRKDGAFPLYFALPTEPNISAAQREERLKAIAPYDALVDAGILQTTRTRIEQHGWFGPDTTVAVIAYELTDKGKGTISPAGKNAFGQPNTLCYGKPRVDEIVHFTEPADAMGMKMSHVSYRYHVADLPDWIDNAKVKAAFPEIAEATAEHLDSKATLVLTNDGWKHEREM